MPETEKTEKVWFLTGPTAGGKTRVGLELARMLDAEIVSLDSMALYRGMDIGTAKPTSEERDQVPHHLIDIRDPNEEFSLSQYLIAAEEQVSEITQRGRRVLFVGGTALYLKSMLRGIFEGPPADWDFRRQVQQEVDELGSQALHDRLALVDPLSAAKFHPNDVRRMIRALEVHRLTGQPISHHQLQFDQPAENSRVAMLDWPRAELHRRINSRVDTMFAAGLIDEVRHLLEYYGDISRTASQAVGYREVIELLLGDNVDDDPAALKETIERVKARTRQFAKRQITWFRSLEECQFIPQQDHLTDIEIAEMICAHFEHLSESSK